MIYEIEFKKSARKEINKLPPEVAKEILKIIYSLATKPRPPHAKKMVGGAGWRLRIGSYRVIYTIEDKLLIIVIIRIGHRKDIYRNH